MRLSADPSPTDKKLESLYIIKRHKKNTSSAFPLRPSRLRSLSSLLLFPPQGTSSGRWEPRSRLQTYPTMARSVRAAGAPAVPCPDPPGLPWMDPPSPTVPCSYPASVTPLYPLSLHAPQLWVRGSIGMARESRLQSKACFLS